jgi:hypothetical protein
MSEVPHDSFGEKKKRRVAADAKKREIERSEAQLTLLQEHANKTTQDREAEENHKKIERKHWRQQTAIANAQRKIAYRLNRITCIAVCFAALSGVGVIGTVLITRQQVLQSAKALRIDQRAWVAPAKWETVLATDGALYPRVYFLNTGKTFALKYSAWLNFAFSLKDIPDSDDQRKTTNFGVLPPNGVGNISLIDSQISPQAVPLIKNGDTVYFYGTIWYEDVFSKKQHWIQFCDGLGKDLATYSPCPAGTHNKTDDPQDQSD